MKSDWEWKHFFNECYEEYVIEKKTNQKMTEQLLKLYKKFFWLDDPSL